MESFLCPADDPLYRWIGVPLGWRVSFPPRTVFASPGRTGNPTLAADPLKPLWFGAFPLRQFFMTIPNELEEVSRIDGCSCFTIC